MRMKPMEWFARTVWRVSLAALVMGIAVLARNASAQGDASAKPVARATVTISDPWARATPAGAHMGAIYLKVLSAGGDRLLKASVPDSVAAKTQIHETIVRHESNGEDSMEMRQVSSLELPAGQEVELKPGGFHLMLIDLKRALKAGELVPVTLRFEKAGTRTVTAEVRGL
jgi:copper(I)-binding protein